MKPTVSILQDVNKPLFAGPLVRLGGGQNLPTPTLAAVLQRIESRESHTVYFVLVPPMKQNCIVLACYSVSLLVHKTVPDSTLSTCMGGVGV